VETDSSRCHTKAEAPPPSLIPFQPPTPRRGLAESPRARPCSSCADVSASQDHVENIHSLAQLYCDGFCHSKSLENFFLFAVLGFELRTLHLQASV
jgi:hypothetical protein